MRPLLQVLFGRPEPLTYRSTLNGRPLGTHWARFAGESAEGIFTFEVYLELDPAVLGRGGAMVHGRARLTTDAQLRPLRYHSEAQGARLAVELEGDTFVNKLPDGSVHRVARAGAEYLLEANQPGLDALMLAHARHSGRLGPGGQLQLYLVNQLLSAPYTLEPAPDLPAPAGAAWLRTSFKEELLLNEEGLLLRSRSPIQGVEVTLVEPGLPLPAWSDAAHLRVPPARYVPPVDAPFELRDLTIPGPATALGATLTVPRSPGPHPAVLFLSGSGTHDRNGLSGELDLGSHEIVDHLSAAGFVGLRYDTRGAGTTQVGADYLQSGLEAIIDDALAAYRFLAARPEVDPRRIVLCGHSQGATVGLALLTTRDVAAAGIALLAGLGRTLEEVIHDQIEAHGRAVGLGPAQIEAQQAQSAEFFDLVRSRPLWRPEEIPDLHYAQVRSVPWIREHLRYSNAELIRQVTCPVLVAIGEKDFQVDRDKDARRLVAAAEAAGRSVTYLPLPGLDHLFKPVAGESTLRSYFDGGERHVDGDFLARLAGWMRSVVAVVP